MKRNTTFLKFPLQAEVSRIALATKMANGGKSETTPVSRAQRNRTTIKMWLGVLKMTDDHIAGVTEKIRHSRS